MASTGSAMLDTIITLNADHPCVRRDVANVHEMHRTVCRVYADARHVAGVQWALDRAKQTVLVLRSPEPPQLHELPPGYVASTWQGATVDAWPVGTHLHFQLTANPSIKRDGKRVACEPRAWLARQADRHGFLIADMDVRSFRVKGTRNGTLLFFAAASFSGRLVVTDAKAFACALRSGIGHARGYGFGLISICK